MILDRILESKREEVTRLAGPAPGRGFKAALTAGDDIALIAEVKKASPSKGVIRADFDPVTIAETYADNGAAAISVLTDAPFFQGSNDYLRAIRERIPTPLLRKEFIIDPLQVMESKLLGADALLLIVAALDDNDLKSLLQLTRQLHMDALVEVHTEEELDRALNAGADFIGVNNRDLRTFHTTLDVSIRLAARMPDQVTKVSESGIRSRDDLLLLQDHGYDAVLVGESLMREDDIGEQVRALLGRNVRAETS